MTVVITIAVVMVLVILVTIDIVRVDPDAAAVAATNPRTDGCDVTARADDGQWRDLRNEETATSLRQGDCDPMHGIDSK